MLGSQSRAKGSEMAPDQPPRGGLLITPVTAMGVEHVYLSYLYLNRGDVDGYLSLLHVGMTLHLPDGGQIRGRGPVGAYQSQPDRLTGTHVIRHVVGSGDRAVAEGRLVLRETGEAVDFAEVFTLAPDGLLQSGKRYYFVPPP